MGEGALGCRRQCRSPDAGNEEWEGGHVLPPETSGTVHQVVKRWEIPSYGDWLQCHCPLSLSDQREIRENMHENSAN